MTNSQNAVSGPCVEKACFSSVTDQSPIGTIIINKDCKIDYCNHAILEMFGYEDAGLFMQDCYITLFPLSLKAKIQKSLKELKSSKDHAEFEQTCTSKDGTKFVARFKTVPMADNVHEDPKLICYIEDASKYGRQIENNEYDNKYVKLIEDVSDGIVIIQDHLIKHFNNTIVKITGYKKEDALGKNFMEFVSPAYKELVIQNHRDRLEGKPVPTIYEIDIISSQGTDISMEISTYMTEFAARPAVLIILRDISKRKEVEKNLIDAKMMAESANRAKSDFLATMSHELRTPLNSIIGFSDLMIGGSVGEMTEKQNRFMGNISSSGKHLLSLINNVLDLSKIEALKMDLDYENFNVCHIIDEVKQLISPLADKKGLKIEFYRDELIEHIYADRLRFKQILFNLASNAIKFTPRGGKIIISTKLLANMVQFSVEDTGIGIAEEDKSKLFQPFVQLDSATNRFYEGTGLGLSLVKRFVELHQGRIWFESEIGKGTSFTFELPLKVNENSEITAKTKFEEVVDFRSEVKNVKTIPQITVSETNESQTKVPVPEIMEPQNARGNELLILVVEDDDASRELLEATLLYEGYRVASAANGKAALELANKIKPFAITLDIMMPGMDGWGVLKQLKEKEQTHKIPVIITSMLDERELGIIWGAVDHFIKPIQKNILLSTLDKIKDDVSKSSLSVLIVDDETNAVELIAAMLDAEEFDVLKAYGGQEAIDIAFAKHPDVIVLDLMMPNVSGFDVIEELKADPDTIDTPIIICTAKDLNLKDRAELDDNVSYIMHKGMFTREDLIGFIEAVQKQDV